LTTERSLREYYVGRAAIMFLIVIPGAGLIAGLVALFRGDVGPLEGLGAVIQMYLVAFPMALVVLVFNGEISRFYAKRKGRSDPRPGVIVALFVGAGYGLLQAPNPVVVSLAALISLMYGLLAEIQVPWLAKESPNHE
jgi:hypothetical protein